MSPQQQWSDLIAYYPDWVAYRRWYQHIPGVQLAVRRRGTLRVDTACGVSDESTGAALTARHVFHVASHSKTLTAVIVLQLAEQGRLGLDDPVRTHVPELADAPVADRTVGELLSHSGGVIRDGTDGDFWQRRRDFPDRAQLLQIARDDSTVTLGRHEHFKYTNIGYGLLGLVIESVTGRDFATAVEERIARPLGLVDLHGDFDTLRAADYAGAHGGVFRSRVRTGITPTAAHSLAAATGARSTAADLSAVFTALLPGDGRLLQEDSQRRQRHWQWTLEEGSRYYGLGMFGDRIAGTELFGHSGGWPGHSTATFADAEDGWVVCAFTNAIDGQASQLASGFFRLRALAKDTDTAPTDDSATRFTGRFESMWGVLDVVRVGGHLFAIHPTEADPGAAVGLQVVDDSTLRIGGRAGMNSYGELMRYDFAADGSVRSLRADSGATMTPMTETED